MYNEDVIVNQYFDWLYSLVCDTNYLNVSYHKLLADLHGTIFTWRIEMDENRAQDGIDLRDRFAKDTRCCDISSLDGPCSVLEMMVALSVKCEENIMSDPEVGDRTGQWFWEMLISLGLAGMSDDNYNRRKVDTQIRNFLSRNYDANGRGGLFTLPHCARDLRDVDIWYQMCWYLNDIVD